MDSTLRDHKKKALIFSILFGGQETTSDLLIFILWKLATNQDLQKSSHQGIFTIDEVYKECFMRIHSCLRHRAPVQRNNLFRYRFKG